MTHDFIVVGAGLTGATCANLLSELGHKVLVVDLRPFVGGTSSDFVNDNGMLAPRYGPHAFHTNSDEVWDYLSRFTTWKSYVQVSLIRHDGTLFDIPINAFTIEKFFGVKFHNEKDVVSWLTNIRPRISPILTSEDLVVSLVGRDLCDTFYASYTLKQWDCPLSDLDRSVAGRIPVRTNRDNRYFSDKHQAMPAEGYTAMVERMLSEVDLELDSAYTLDQARLKAHTVIWTGPMDEAFDCRLGQLEWRSLTWEEKHTNEILPAACVHEADMSTEITRTMDTSYFFGQRGKNFNTTHYIEKSSPFGEKFYPVLRPNLPKWDQQNELVKNYHFMANNLNHVYFLGRMGRHRYLNMDQAVADALAFMKRNFNISVNGEAKNG